MSRANEQHKIDNTLKEFGKCTLALCEVLHGDTPLDHIETLFIENHIQVLQMAYLHWKRKNKVT
jgi:hypothetical protein